MGLNLSALRRLAEGERRRENPYISIKIHMPSLLAGRALRPLVDKLTQVDTHRGEMHENVTL
jgi:hypothetical protein